MARKKFDRSLIPPAPDFQNELQILGTGIHFIAGIDEAGRGALAGPIYAAAVVLPPNLRGSPHPLDGVRDSKELSAKIRARLGPTIRNYALTFGIGSASHQEVDEFGVIPATRMAIRRALTELDPFPDHLLVDALSLPAVPVPQTSLIKGDARSMSIAAASILAKTARDGYMQNADVLYPGYGLAQNKGYGTKGHLINLKKLGPCEIHRRSFSPLKPRLF